MRRDEVLFANEAFYLAFANADLDAMDRLWADREDVVCAHPGWPVLTDRESVMESWRRILGNPDQPRVVVHAVGTVTLGAEASLVTCYETVADSVMVAVNVFEAGTDGPRLVAHYAGLCSEPPELPTRPPPTFDA